MYPNDQTVTPCSGTKRDCDNAQQRNAPIAGCVPDGIGRAGTSTTEIRVKGSAGSAAITRSDCILLPLKSGAVLRLSWNQLATQGATESAYSAGWKPGGAGSVFSFLPRLNVYSTLFRRAYKDTGTLDYDSAGTAQSYVPLAGSSTTTYFTETDSFTKYKWEYWAGTGISSASGEFGTLNRQYDRNGNTLQYNYTPSGGLSLLRSISGDLAGNVIPYFEYASETSPAPITKIYILDKGNVQKSRSIYFEYINYPDPFGASNPYLSKIIMPNGCVRQYDAVTPIKQYGFYEMLREVDSEGYQTYFEYQPSSLLLSKVTEPEGRITYYDYVSASYTRETQLGRSPKHFVYGIASGGTGGMPVILSETDPLGYTSYYEYGLNGQGNFIARYTKKIDPNGNVTYYGYNEISFSLNQSYSLTTQTNAYNGARITNLYSLFNYDISRTTGPRLAPGFQTATYFEYSNSNVMAVMDPFANRQTLGRDSAGRVIKSKDFGGGTTYFNYDLATGALKSISNPVRNVTYFAYDSFLNKTARVSPRWVERGSFTPFATYYEYDSLDRMTKVVNPQGSVTYFDWTSRGDLLGSVDPRGISTTYTYNGLRLATHVEVMDRSGNLLSEEHSGYDIYKNRIRSQDALGQTTYFNYDPLDRLASRQDPLGNVTSFFYNSVSDPTEILDARGYTTYFFYDPLRRKTASRDALGNSIYHFYDLGDNRTHTLDPRGNATYYDYDQLDRLRATRDALWNQTYFFYDGLGRTSILQNARLKSTYYFYDSASRLTAVRNALREFTYFFYDTGDNLTGIRNPANNRTYFTYDTLDRLQSTRDPVGNFTYFFYDAVGNRTEIRDPRANTTYFFYDGMSRVSALRDPMGGLAYFSYDLNGNRSASLNPNLHATYFGYDALNRLARTQDALGGVTYFAYDPVGLLASVVDPNGRTDSFGYDPLRRPSASLRPDGGTTYFSYDPSGNLTQNLNPMASPTYYGYDSVNRLTRIQDALARTLYFEYNEVSKVTKTLNAEGSSTVITYDVIDRPIQTTYTPAGTDTAASLRSNPYFVYDNVGNVAQIGDLWGKHLFAYDAARRLLRHQYPNGSKVYFEYDAASNVVNRIYPGAAGKAGAAYDSLNRTTRLQAPSGATAYFSYDPLSQRTSQLFGSGSRLDMAYDAAERIQAWRNSSKTGSPLSYFEYSRDPKGLITRAVREATHAVYYTYDANDRLTDEVWATADPSPVEVYAFRYAYDLAGNRIRARVNGVDTYYFYDQANQLTVKGTTAAFASPTYFVYDKNGSLTDQIDAGGSTTFAYNVAGLAARLRWKDGTSTYFFYDGNLQRYAMNHLNAVTYFLWDGPNLLQELNPNGSVKEEHTHAPVPIPGIGQLLETNRPGQTPQKIYPVMDPRGTVTKWVQSDGTTVVASREYDAFGQIIPGSAQGTWPSRFGYQGQAWIEIFSGNGAERLLLSPTRFYSPGEGRFIQNEPLLGRRPVVNYLYASHNPVILVDPFGLQDASSDWLGLKRLGATLWEAVTEPLKAINDVIVGATVAVAQYAGSEIMLEDVPFASHSAWGTQYEILNGVDPLSAVDAREADALWNILTFGGKGAADAYQAYKNGSISLEEFQRRAAEVPENIMLGILAGNAGKKPCLRIEIKARQMPSSFPPGAKVANLGGVGEVKANVNVQPGRIGHRSNAANMALENARQVKAASGQPVIAASGDRLPLQTGAFDYVVTNSVPVGYQVRHFGPDFAPSEIARILKPGGQWVGNSAPPQILFTQASPWVFPWVPNMPNSSRR